jgi:acetyl esterase
VLRAGVVDDALDAGVAGRLRRQRAGNLAAALCLALRAANERQPTSQALIYPFSRRATTCLQRANAPTRRY